MYRVGPGIFLSATGGTGGGTSISSILRDNSSSSWALKFGNSLTVSRVMSLRGTGPDMLPLGGSGGGGWVEVGLEVGLEGVIAVVQNKPLPKY